jgi:CheY-like chemotaxis protein
MHTPCILLVDDFEDGLDMYREYLTFRGYQVVVARNGEEAIAQARRHRPAVILLDIRMPVMTGTDAMRALRHDPSFARVPIVALTAHALDDERCAALAAGFDELISKPCLPDQLAVAVERILAATRVPQAIPAALGSQTNPETDTLDRKSERGIVWNTMPAAAAVISTPFDSMKTKDLSVESPPGFSATDLPPASPGS